MSEPQIQNRTNGNIHNSTASFLLYLCTYHPRPSWKTEVRNLPVVSFLWEVVTTLDQAFEVAGDRGFHPMEDTMDLLLERKVKGVHAE